ncbi:hypothetical protein D3C75_956100 [compost metagenome]
MLAGDRQLHGPQNLALVMNGKLDPAVAQNQVMSRKVSTFIQPVGDGPGAQSRKHGFNMGVIGAYHRLALRLYLA